MLKARLVELWVYEKENTGILAHPERIRVTVACSWNSGNQNELNEPGREGSFLFCHGVCPRYLGYHFAFIKKELSIKEFESRRMKPDTFINL